MGSKNWAENAKQLAETGSHFSDVCGGDDGDGDVGGGDDGDGDDGGGDDGGDGDDDDGVKQARRAAN